MGLSLPAGHANPAGHGAQSLADRAPGAPRYVPAAHSRWALAPSLQYEPAGHALHPVAAVSCWYVPGSQSVHLPLPSRPAQLPARHSVHAASLALPGTGLNLPAAQSTHEAFDAEPLSGLYEPAGHGVHTIRVAAPSLSQ